MIAGSCLCGGVRFEVAQSGDRFEICHCHRCRKVSGASGLPALRVRSADYRMVAGKDLVTTYEAPILYEPPAYQAYFCSVCGSPVPPAEPSDDTLEIAAGLFDDDPGVTPERHIFTDFLPPWHRVADSLPQFSVRELVKQRHGVELPEGFVPRSHHRKKRP